MMADNALIQKLESITELNEGDKRQLRSLCSDVKSTPAKRDIIREGERPDHLHLMVSGWAARYKVLPDGSRQITAFLIPGDFCDIHITILAKMDHAILALTPCKVAYVDSEKIDEITSRNNSLARALWWTTLVDEATLREWVVNNGRRDAYARIGHLLCEMHLRMKMVGLVSDDALDLPLTQEELADATGMTAVHTNRVLQRLRGEGLIELKDRVLRIPDVRALQDAAGFDPSYFHIQRRTRKN